MSLNWKDRGDDTAYLEVCGTVFHLLHCGSAYQIRDRTYIIDSVHVKTLAAAKAGATLIIEAYLELKVKRAEERLRLFKEAAGRTE